MAAGDTITQSLADSLDTVVASARQVREQEGVMPNLVDKVTLDQGTGTSWREISMSQLTAQAITETTRLDNPQQMSDTLLLFNVNVEVSYHYNSALSSNALPPTAELPGGHVSFHDVDPVLLVEGHSRNLIEADDVVLADQTTLPVGVVHKHFRDRRFAA